MSALAGDLKRLNTKRRWGYWVWLTGVGVPDALSVPEHHQDPQSARVTPRCQAPEPSYRSVASATNEAIASANSRRLVSQA
jgi:hypothetical protein